MFPQVASAHGSARMLVGQSHAGINPAHLQPVNLPAPLQRGAPTHFGQRGLGRNEKEMYYALRHTPQPWEYSQSEQPLFFDGGNPMSQFLPPQGYGGAPTAYSFAGMNPHMTRPTYAYNRGVMTPYGLPGHPYGAGSPTMYAWPNQYYPGGSNTFIPSWEATGLIVKYTRSPSFFRLNRYTSKLTVKKDQGYYLTLSGDDPYRVVSINDFIWEDSANAPGGRQQRQGFGFVPYKTARFCYPFSLGKKSVDQADWPILAEHAAMQSAKAMTVRTMLNYTLVTTAGNWTGSWGTNTSAASGTWSTSTTAQTYIQRDLNTAAIAVEIASGGIVSDEDALQFTMNPQQARGVAVAPEYREYIQGSPDALAALTDWRNPNRKYGLAPYLYGLKLAVENAVVVTTPKSGNVPVPPDQARSYVWARQYGLVSSKPAGIVAQDEQTLDFSTVCHRFYEEMTVEQKTDTDNRREIGRVVEDFVCTLQAPQTGYLLTGLA